VGVTAGRGGTGTTGALVGALLDGVADVLAGGWVVADSTGLVVVVTGLGVVLGVRVTVGRAGLTVADSSRGAEVRGVAARRGWATVAGWAVGWWLGLGTGAGLGGAGALVGVFSSAGSSPGNGSTALDRTGPPARLTVISPP
jgi:hypothetical protein